MVSGDMGRTGLILPSAGGKQQNILLAGKAPSTQYLSDMCGALTWLCTTCALQEQWQESELLRILGNSESTLQ